MGRLRAFRGRLPADFKFCRGEANGRSFLRHKRLGLSGAAGDTAKADRPETHAFLAIPHDLLTVHPMTVDFHETGLALAERHSLSTYDAMISASALHAGCDTLWSEEMQHGMTLGEGLRILNPFRVADCAHRRKPAEARRHEPLR